ncbi:galactose-binding domain-like protein [Baffinella frigidus]|nr:galactose-binding domain-like protein [Cryptophyta sp. CCMP2293]
MFDTALSDAEMQRKCLCKLPTLSTAPCIGNVVYNAEDSKIRFDSAVYNRLSGQSQAQGRLNSDSGWAPPDTNPGHWIQYNVGKVKAVNGVVTQGYVGWNRWVKSFKVKVSADGKKWRWVQCGNSFQGNTDTDTQVRTVFDKPVMAQFVRIYPESPGNGNGFAMRAAILVCEEDCERGNLDYTFRNSLSSSTEGPPLLASWGEGTFTSRIGYQFHQGKGLELDEAHCIKDDKVYTLNPKP